MSNSACFLEGIISDSWTVGEVDGICSGTADGVSVEVGLGVAGVVVGGFAMVSIGLGAD